MSYFLQERHPEDFQGTHVRDTCTPMSVAALLMRAEKPASLAVQTDDRTGCEHGTHTTWDYIQSQGQAVKHGTHTT